jgi:hypothetical protein
MRSILCMSTAVAAFTLAGAAMAATVTDPVGDFIASYTGPPSADLDVVSFSANFDGVNFLLSSTMAAPISTNTGFYVIGVDRGGSPAPFTSIGAPGVLFNAVIVLQQDATGAVNLIPGGSTPLPAGSVTISGSTISAIVPLDRLPSTGFQPLQYGFNIWPRTSAVTGNAAISDFAPNNSTITAVPEPHIWLTMILGCAAIGLQMRRRLSRCGSAPA